MNKKSVSPANKMKTPSNFYFFKLEGDIRRCRFRGKLEGDIRGCYVYGKTGG